MDRLQAVFQLASWHQPQPRKLDSGSNFASYVAPVVSWNMESFLNLLIVRANISSDASVPDTYFDFTGLSQNYKIAVTRVDMRLESSSTSSFTWLKALATCITAIPSKKALYSLHNQPNVLLAGG